MDTTSIVVYHATSPLVESGVDVKELVLVAAELVVATGPIEEGQVTAMELIVIGLVVTFGQIVLSVFPALK